MLLLIILQEMVFLTNKNPVTKSAFFLENDLTLIHDYNPKAKTAIK